MKVIGVIPARYESRRFPGKPLAFIRGKPMIQHVYEQVRKSKDIDQVIVATDHDQIRETVNKFGGFAVMTNSRHETGTDRILEVMNKVEGDLFVNIQGDEPLICPKLVDRLIQYAKKLSGDIAVTAKVKIDQKEDIMSPNIVKVVTDRCQNALYFSRAAIPFQRSNQKADYYKHLGIYVYSREILENFSKLSDSMLEKSEMLEQLRLLEHTKRIKVIETDYNAVGVDIPEDIEKVEEILGEQ